MPTSTYYQTFRWAYPERYNIYCHNCSELLEPDSHPYLIQVSCLGNSAPVVYWSCTGCVTYWRRNYSTATICLIRYPRRGRNNEGSVEQEPSSLPDRARCEQCRRFMSEDNENDLCDTCIRTFRDVRHDCPSCGEISLRLRRRISDPIISTRWFCGLCDSYFDNYDYRERTLLDD